VVPERPLRVLLVEDDELVRRALSAALSRALPCDVRSFADGETALVSGLDIDVAIVDLHLGRMDGLSVAAALRERTPRVPVVLLTGALDLPDVPAGVVTARKPIDIASLVALMRRAVL
jgi:DNA-binding NarL/FixJ family response regulator